MSKSSNMLNSDSIVKNLSSKGLTEAEEKEANMIRKVFVSNEEDEIAEFEADKNKDIEDDLPEDNTGAPDGWGAWTGAGIERDHKKEANIRRRREEKLKQLKSSRKDVNLKNVKINEKRDKKFKKYMVNELPHEYKSIAQFE